MKKKREKKPLTNRITFRMADDMLEFLHGVADKRGIVDISDLIRMTVHDLMVKENPSKYGKDNGEKGNP